MYKHHQSSPPFLLFLHLQKTAGMTLQELLRRKYGKGLLKRAYNWLRDTSPEGLSLSEAIKRSGREDKMFMGHFCFGIHAEIGREFTYMTMLREPAARLISLYHYSHEKPEAHYYGVAKNRTLEEFLFNCELPELDNGITRLLVGRDVSHFINRTPFGKMEESHLEEAKGNLEKYFSFVGIQEKFDESILLLAHLMGWKTPYYVTLNVGRKDTAKRRRDEELLGRVRARNPLDCELYEWCRKRFEEAWQGEFVEPEAMLASYQRRNARYQRLAGPVAVARIQMAKTGKRLLKRTTAKPLGGS